MSMSGPLNHLGSILYHSEAIEIPYSRKPVTGHELFCRFLQQTGSSPNIKLCMFHKHSSPLDFYTMALPTAALSLPRYGGACLEDCIK